MIVLDPGQPKDNQQGNVKIGNTETENFDYINLHATKIADSSFKLYINTLSPFSSYKPGSYALSDLKKMTGTQSFLELPDERKSCQTETFEVCRNQMYMEKVQEKCGCVPWSLSSALTQEVRFVVFVC